MSTVSGSKGRADRPARHSEEDSSINKAPVSFAASSATAQVSDSGIARVTFRVAMSDHSRDIEPSFFTVTV